MNRWRRPALYGLLIAGLAAAPAVATTHLYANGSLGAGGSWLNPVKSNVLMNYDRMSTQNPSDVVHIRFENTAGVIESETWSYQFVQSAAPAGIATRAWCLNNASYTESGYCAWYN
jgi:hypothetical protein